MKSVAAVVLVFSSALSAAAQDAPEVTRADLAVSLLRFEMAVQNAELSGDRLAEVNQQFDAATLAFFQQRFADALSQIDGLAIDLMPEIDRDAAIRAAALRVTLEPPVYNLAEAPKATITCTVLYPPGPEGAIVDPAIAIVGPDGSIVGGARPRMVSSGLAGDTLAIDDSIDFASLAPGRYRFLLVPGDVKDAEEPGKYLVSGSFLVAPGSLDAVRIANESRIAALEASDPKLAHAIVAVSGRNALLTDSPDTSNTAQLMLDLTAIAREVDAEINAIAGGSDPYFHAAGDYWRMIKSPVKDFPVRIYAPHSVNLEQPLPLVIAFHGAGGDENMFMDAYGVGAIKRVADAQGFLLVTPLTYAFNANAGEQFDALIEALSYDYPIDRDRIYAVGHSMGGGATANLVNVRGARLAAAATICGFRPLTGDAVPPTLAMAAELDPIVNPTRIEPFAIQAAQSELPVEYQLVPNYGHTMIVGDYIDDAIQWMFEKTRN